MCRNSIKSGKNIVAVSFRGLLFWSLIKVLSSTVGCLATCESVPLGSSPSGQFVLSTYDGYLVDDICRWTIQPDLQDFVIVIDFKEIDLSINENLVTSRCAAAVTINGERFSCHRKEPFCLTYATSDKCMDAVSEYQLCHRRNQTIPKLEMEFDAYLYTESTQKFKAEYNILECKPKPTTTTQVLQTPNSAGQIKDRNRGAERTPPLPTTLRTTSTERTDNNMELIVILLPIAIALLVALVMTVWCKWRRNRSKSRDDDSNSDVNSFGATKDTMANVAYESWNPPQDNRPKLPERTHGVVRNLTIPSVTIPDSDYSDINIYEAIPPPPPSIITPRFTEFGQRYFDIGFNRINMDGAEKIGNIYEQGDESVIEQSPYDMAIPNPGELSI